MRSSLVFPFLSIELIVEFTANKAEEFYHNILDQAIARLNIAAERLESNLTKQKEIADRNITEAISLNDREKSLRRYIETRAMNPLRKV